LEIFVDEEELLSIHDILDPLDSGFVSYKILCSFVALRKWHPDSDSTSSEGSGLVQSEQIMSEEEPEVQAFLNKEKQELRDLFRCYTKGTSQGGQAQTLTLTHLRGVKATVDRKSDPFMLSRSRLRREQGEDAEQEGEEDPDADLKAMILDANLSEDRKNGWRAGVTFEEFEEAMRRLDMFTSVREH
jgi:hypothetical protein